MGLVRNLLFENPLTLLTVFGMAAVVTGIVWTRTGSRRTLATAIGLAAAGVVVLGLDWAVETEHERLVRTIDTMTRAVATGDADTFVERISDAYGTGKAGKGSLAAVVHMGLERVRASADTPSIDQRDGEATVTQAYTFRAAPGQPVMLPKQYERVVWEGVFVLEADREWRLRKAMAVQPRPMAPEEAARYLQQLQQDSPIPTRR